MTDAYQHTPQIKALRDGYKLMSISCDEAQLRGIDEDGRIAQFTPSEIKQALDELFDARISAGKEVYARHVSPKSVLWHLKKKRGDTLRHQEQSAPFVRDPQKTYYDDALATFRDLPQIAQDYARHLFLRTDEGRKHTQAWDRADASMSKQERRRAKLLLGASEMGERGWFERWGAATLALRILRNRKHPQHAQMQRLIEAGRSE